MVVGSVGDGVAAVVGDWINVVTIYQRPAQVALTIAVVVVLAEAIVSRRTIAPSLRAFGVLFVGTSLLHVIQPPRCPPQSAAR